MKKVMKAVAAIMLMTVVVCAAGCKKPENQNEESVTLTTLTPQNITPTSADLGAKYLFPMVSSLENLAFAGD